MIISTYGAVLSDPCAFVAFDVDRIHKLFDGMDGSHGTAMETFYAHSYSAAPNGLNWIRIAVVPNEASAAYGGAFKIPSRIVVHSEIVIRVDRDLTMHVVRDRAHANARSVGQLPSDDPRLALPIMAFNRPMVAPNITINKYGCYVD